jgi:hypothetical protein
MFVMIKIEVFTDNFQSIQGSSPNHALECVAKRFSHLCMIWSTPYQSNTLGVMTESYRQSSGRTDDQYPFTVQSLAISSMGIALY